MNGAEYQVVALLLYLKYILNGAQWRNRTFFRREFWVHFILHEIWVPVLRWILMRNFGLPFKWMGYSICRSQWPRGLRRRFVAARLLSLWFRIRPAGRMFVCSDFCVLSGRGLCDELIPRPEESYRLCCVVVCDLETSWMRRPWLTGGCRAKKQKKNSLYLFMLYL